MATRKEEEIVCEACCDTGDMCCHLRVAVDLGADSQHLRDNVGRGASATQGRGDKLLQLTGLVAHEGDAVAAVQLHPGEGLGGGVEGVHSVHRPRGRDARLQGMTLTRKF